MLKVTKKGFMRHHNPTDRQTAIEDKKSAHPESPKPAKAGGRPKKDATDKATERITLYLTAAEKEKILKKKRFRPNQKNVVFLWLHCFAWR